MEIEYGYCQCGCGEKTNLITSTNKHRGLIKGQMRRFIPGHNSRGRSIADRFWAKVAITANPDKCWEWQAYRTPLGYGQFGIARKIFTASRVAYELAYGKIPDGLCVLHNCPDGDNPACVNPKHLFLGTQLDNIEDMVEKGRQRGPSGEASHTAKLTTAQVKLIRQLHVTGGVSQLELSRRMGVSANTIRDIVNGKHWKHVE